MKEEKQKLIFYFQTPQTPHIKEENPLKSVLMKPSDKAENSKKVTIVEDTDVLYARWSKGLKEDDKEVTDVVVSGGIKKEMGEIKKETIEKKEEKKVNRAGNVSVSKCATKKMEGNKKEQKNKLNERGRKTFQPNLISWSYR